MSTVLLRDDPRPGVRRLTLNRPEKRNAIDNELRGALFDALEAADADDAVRVTVVRGAGPCFSSGYDLRSDLGRDRPYHSAPGGGAWSRHVSEGWFRLWDLAKPVIAQVHGYAMAGGSELAAACDLVYVAEDATFSYPVVRVISPPDFQFHPWLVGMRPAMEMMLTGDAVTGAEAAATGLANRCFPAGELEAGVLDIAARIAMVPAAVLQVNKRTVHRAMETRGARAGIRGGSELQGLATGRPGAMDAMGDRLAAVKQAARTTREGPG